MASSIASLEPRIFCTVFTFMSFIGVLILMGVVVNNGIVMIVRINQLRHDGLARRDALIQGAKDRLRPILMTMGTAILGMVPLCFEGASLGGDGPQYYPMARAMIDAGLAIVLATDFNPGSSPTPSIPMVLSLAVTQMKMTPAEGVTASTINAAYSLGRGDRRGEDETGWVHGVLPGARPGRALYPD